MKQLTGSDNILIHEELLREELSDSILVEFNCSLGVREIKFSWRSKQLGRHKQALVEPVEVSSLIAKFSELCEHNSSNKTLFRAKSVSKCGAWVLLEYSSEGVDYIEFLEDSVYTVVPLDFCLSKLSI